MIKVISGNLLDLAEEGKFDYIVHGCNCFNAMGAGIAAQIRNRYPQAAEIDSLTKRGDINKLGNFTKTTQRYSNKPGSFTIINAYTQYGVSMGEDVFHYASLEVVLEKLVRYAMSDDMDRGFSSWGFPRIGQGLAGGDAVRINKMLEDFSKRVDRYGGVVTIVDFSPS
jgi:O-acetyl-ADP-ribose deacetylase (regulator of RNase III)